MPTITPLLLLTALQTPPQTERPALMVGDLAPAIQVVEWVQGKPITAFDAGQTYVVEFWATWCGPCKVAIPHLNELQRGYGERVHFMGVSIWEKISAEDPYSVPKFVQAMGDKMTYTVASDRVKEEDPERMANAWMVAAGQSGIPTSFIVNKDGRIAWIGHPMSIDKPLAEVVAGTWDLAAASKKHALELETKAIRQKLAPAITKAKKAKDFSGALRLIEDAVAQNPALEANYGTEKYFLLLEAGRAPEAGLYGQRLVSDVHSKNAQALNMLAWTIVDPVGKWKNAGDFDLAVRAAEQAVALVEGKDASILDTLGLALFRAGKIEQAIEKQQRAVELSKGTDLEKELQERLDEFRAAKAKSNM